MGLLLRRGVSAVLLAASRVGPPASPFPPPEEEQLRAKGLPTDGPGLLQFLRERLTNPADRARAAILVRQLGNRSYKVRVRATAELSAMSPAALPVLRGALGDADLELSRRVRLCIAAIERHYDPALLRAAVDLIAERQPRGGFGALLAYLTSTPSTPDATVKEEVLVALAILALDKKGRPRRYQVKALGNANRTALRVALRARLLRAEKDCKYRALVVSRLKQLEECSNSHELLREEQKRLLAQGRQRLARLEQLLRRWERAIRELHGTPAPAR